MNITTFYPCPENLIRGKLNINRQICLVKEISTQDSIQTVAWFRIHVRVREKTGM